MSVRNGIARPVSTLFSALSLLVCAVIITFWIRGQFKSDWFQWQKTDPQANTWRALDMVSGRSGFYFSRQAFSFDRPGNAEEYALQLKRIAGFGHAEGEAQSMPYQGTFWNRLGFGSRVSGEQMAYSGTFNNRSNYRYSFDGWHVPYWFLLFLFACGGLPLILRVHAHRRKLRRIRNNQCLTCGYDLRNSPQRCPECGQPVNTPSQHLVQTKQ